MKIAVLNECFLSENHINRLKKQGEVVIFENTISEMDAIERLKGIDIAIWDGFICPQTPKTLETADSLKLVVLPHTGYFMVDLKSANSKNIKIVNCPGFSKQSVAEMVIGLMFAVDRKIPLMDKNMRINPFDSDPSDLEHQNKYWGFNIAGKTMGILGFGTIGSMVAKLALGLGMKVIAHNRSPRSMERVAMMSKEDVLRKADVISINVSSLGTENYISQREIEMMKPSAILINVDQGKQVDTEAIYLALKEKRIGGAGLDQVAGLHKDHPMLKLDNVVLTPHAGSSTNESFRENLPELVVLAIEEFLKGSPINLVN